MYLTVCPLRGRGSIPRHSRVFFPASVAENGSISPQWHHITCGHRGGRLKPSHRHTMAEIILMFATERPCVLLLMILPQSHRGPSSAKMATY